MKKRLTSGETIIFTNEQHLAKTGGRHLNGADCWYLDDPETPNWAIGFKITFNGQLVHSTKTFPPFQRKLNELILHYDLTEIKLEEDDTYTIH